MSTTKVFVGSMPPGCKPEELRHLFSRFGVVVECDIMNRCGFVHMESSDMAENAIVALNGTEFKGQPIVVERGRPKDRKGGPSGGGNRGPGGNINRRSMQGDNSNNAPSGSGGGRNFNRGISSGGNNFRGGNTRGNRGASFTSTSTNFGPMRNDGNNRQQRNAPYSKGPPQQNSDGPNQGLKNKFNQGGGAGGNKFGNSAANSNNSFGGRFGGNVSHQFQNWDNNSSGGPSGNNHMNAPSGRRNFKNSPSGGFGGNVNNNDFHSNNSGGGGGAGGGGGYGNQRGAVGGSAAPHNGVGQDRRGFALPAVDHQQQQQIPFGAQQGRFGNGPMIPSGNNSDNGIFQRNRNNSSTNSGNQQSGRGGFNPSRGGFSGRGGFNARRGGGGPPPQNERSFSQNQGGGGGFNNNRGSANGHNQNGLSAYQEFPPLGSRNRNNNGPRPNMGGNRRY